MSYYVGAYAASPCWSEWNPDLERELLEGLRERRNVAGLEHPVFGGGLHRWDEAWFLRHVDPRWSFLFTCIPGTMDRLAQDPEFGLASEDESGRQAAVTFVELARFAALRLNEALGRRAVTAVAVHSAPRRGPSGARSSAGALARSLSQLAERDWMGARLLVEHCDAFVPSHAPDKGFLTLEEELAAIEESGTGARLLINWGRSAVETRSAEGPLAHVRAAGEALGGLMFSGCSVGDPVYGDWRDGHAPFSSTVPSSLMTPALVGDCLAAAGPKAELLGLKIKPRPETLTIPERLAHIDAGLRVLDDCRGSVR